MTTIWDIIGLILSIIQVLPLAFTLVVLWRTRRRMQQQLERERQKSGSAPMALAVGLAGSIKGAVQQYLDANNLQMPLESYVHPEFVAAEEYPHILQDLLKIKDRLTQQHITELHLFYKGPVTLAMGIGATFDNWVPVKVYDYKDGVYILVMIIEKEWVRGLLPEVLREGEEMISDVLG